MEMTRHDRTLDEHKPGEKERGRKGKNPAVNTVQGEEQLVLLLFTSLSAAIIYALTESLLATKLMETVS